MIVIGDRILFYDRCNFEHSHTAVNPMVDGYRIAVGTFGSLQLAATRQGNLAAV
jgi:hypothetical protein